MFASKLSPHGDLLYCMYYMIAIYRIHNLSREPLDLYHTAMKMLPIKTGVSRYVCCQSVQNLDCFLQCCDHR